MSRSTPNKKGWFRRLLSIVENESPREMVERINLSLDDLKLCDGCSKVVAIRVKHCNTCKRTGRV